MEVHIYMFTKLWWWFWFMDRSKKCDIKMPSYQSIKHVFSASYRPSSLLKSFGMDRIQDCPYSQEAQSLAVEAFIPSTKYDEDYERSYHSLSSATTESGGWLPERLWRKPRWPLKEIWFSLLNNQALEAIAWPHME